ncbi:MAG: NfeD family protein [Anaerolineaceae bacterium]
MNFILDPNVAYLLLIIGFFLAILALFSPGTGVLEIGALFMIVMAGYSIYNLPINWWALVILIIGVFPFLLALRKSKNWIFLGLALLSFMVGSIFLFKPETGIIAVHPVLVVLVSVIIIPLVWLIVKRGLEAIGRTPVHNLEKLIGAIGEARSDILAEGTIHINGEEWSARSNSPIRAGSKIRVVNREGLILVVEPVEPTNL